MLARHFCFFCPALNSYLSGTNTTVFQRMFFLWPGLGKCWKMLFFFSIKITVIDEACLSFCPALNSCINATKFADLSPNVSSVAWTQKILDNLVSSLKNIFDDQAWLILLPGSQIKIKGHQKTFLLSLCFEGQISNQNTTINVWPLSRPLKKLKETVHVWFSVFLFQTANPVSHVVCRRNFLKKQFFMSKLMFYCLLCPTARL